ncbi:MAG: M48 family metallopeptidase [Acidimicrobiia bacterium]
MIDPHPETPVDIVRSARRTKTVQAAMVDGRLRLMVPERMSDAEAHRWAEQMKERIARKRTSSAIDLIERAIRLSRRHRLPTPDSIEWSDRQLQRWGSCTPATRAIRISNRVADMPPWVLDYVIVHELAHLAEPGHGPAFHRLVDRYELAERARGYLMAKAES